MRQVRRVRGKRDLFVIDRLEGEDAHGAFVWWPSHRVAPGSIARAKLVELDEEERSSVYLRTLEAEDYLDGLIEIPTGYPHWSGHSHLGQVPH